MRFACLEEAKWQIPGVAILGNCLKKVQTAFQVRE